MYKTLLSAYTDAKILNLLFIQLYLIAPCINNIKPVSTHIILILKNLNKKAKKIDFEFSMF